MMSKQLIVLCMMLSFSANAHNIHIESESVKARLAFYGQIFSAQAFVDLHERAKYDATECSDYTPVESAKLTPLVKQYEQKAQERKEFLQQSLEYALLDRIYASDKTYDTDEAEKKSDCEEFKRQVIEQSLIEDYAQQLKFLENLVLTWGELPTEHAFIPTELSLLYMDIIGSAMQAFCTAVDVKFTDLADYESKILATHAVNLKVARTKMLFTRFELIESDKYSPKSREVLLMNIALAAYALEASSKELVKNKSQNDKRVIPEKAYNMCGSIYDDLEKGTVPEYYRLAAVSTGKKFFDAW